MTKEIENFIVENKGLLDLYHTDNSFRKCIRYAMENNMSIQDTLVLALLKGYESK